MAENNEEEVADYSELQEGEGEYYEEEEGGAGEEGVNEGDVEKTVQDLEAELEELNKMQQQVTDQLTTAADKIDETSM